MPQDSCSVTMMRGVPVISPGAEIDITSAYALRETLITVAAQGYATIAVDLSQAQSCDSAGLSVLTRAHKLAASEGGGIRLIAGSASVMRIVSLTGIDQLIPTFGSLDDALIETPAIAIFPSAAARLATTHEWHVDAASSSRPVAADLDMHRVPCAEDLAPVGGLAATAAAAVGGVRL